MVFGLMQLIIKYLLIDLIEGMFSYDSILTRRD